MTAATTSGTHVGTQDGSEQQHDEPERELHDLPGGTLPGDRPQAPADIAGPAAVAYGPVHVTEHPTRQHGVEELRAVVRGGRGAQRDGDAEAAGDQVPSPRPRRRS